MKMAIHHNDKTVHFLFDIGLIGKAVDGTFEIIGGIALFVVNPGQIDGLLRMITLHELSTDPHDIVANLLLHSVQHLASGTQTFAAFFLLWHGAVKVGLVWALFRKYLWAYPVAIFAFALFLAYQLYRYTHTHSIWLAALSALDLFVIAITWLEYRRLCTSGRLSRRRMN
ncbi:MAG: DUF2127 domain-containing protein [Gallionella sp.]|nr:DUF2127 domain-containing protein [Gallionella sp.]